MALRPEDIKYKEFRRSLRGFDEQEVTEFLQQVARKFEDLIKANADLQEKVETYAGRLEQYTRMEDVLHNALLVAQETAAEVKANAGKEAALIRQEAEQEAEALRRSAQRAAEEAQAMYNAVLERVRLLRTQVRGMLVSHLDLLDQEERLLQEFDGEPGRLEAAAAAQGSPAPAAAQGSTPDAAEVSPAAHASGQAAPEGEPQQPSGRSPAGATDPSPRAAGEQQEATSSPGPGPTTAAGQPIFPDTSEELLDRARQALLSGVDGEPDGHDR